MSRELAEPPPPSRYSYAAATKEVARELATRERGTQKQLAAGPEPEIAARYILDSIDELRAELANLRAHLKHSR